MKNLNSKNSVVNIDNSQQSSWKRRKDARPPEIIQAAKKILEEIKLAEMCIVSQVELKDISDKSIDAMSFEEEKIAVVISLASGEKCERCWTVLPEVDSNPHNLCERCDTVWQSFP